MVKIETHGEEQREKMFAKAECWNEIEQENRTGANNFEQRETTSDETLYAMSVCVCM